MNIPSFDQYFMTMVYLAATRSKDESTHIGAVIVGKEKEIISLGYNSFPRGIDDTVAERQEAPEKYFWFEHAERNAIYLAGQNLSGCTMYTQGIPCSDCARGVIQSGIVEVVVHGPWHRANSKSKWKASCNRSKKMFEERGVSLRIWDGEILAISGLRDGKEVNYI